MNRKMPYSLCITLSCLALSLSLTIPTARADDDLLKQHAASAREYMNSQQWDYAGYEWRAALSQNPKDPEANIGLAESLMRSGLSADAIRQLEEARKNITNNLPLELAYGRALELVQQNDKAMQIYLSNLNRLPLEAESFRRLVALAPKLPDTDRKKLENQLSKIALEASKNGRKALQEKQYQRAANYFAVSTVYFPNLSDLNDYGVVLLLLGQYDAANQQFGLLHRAQSAKWEYFANASFVSLGKGKTAEAAATMEKAIGLCPDTAKKALLYNDLGFIYENQGKWQKARSAYERSVELNPGFTKAKLNLAYAYQKDMAYENAIHTYRDILRKESSNPMVWNRLGFVYELAHREKQAISAYRHATELNPDDKEGFYNLAILYRKMGETQAADREHRRMMSIEFRQIENGKDINPVTRGQVRDPRVRLLDYVDVFLTEPALVGQS
jgi:tetratricopeptide (TPR) repeat protein